MFIDMPELTHRHKDGVEVILKAARRQDISRIRRLLQESDLPSADIDEDSGHQFMLAWKAHTLIGTVALEAAGKTALLRSLAVVPQYRRQGIATELIKTIEAQAGSQGIRTLYLLTLTAADFFAARGYRKTDRGRAPDALQRTTEFHSACPASAVCMKKEIV